MPEAFIIDAVRTPVTRRGGGLAAVHPADLGAHVIRHLLGRTGADPEAADDVVFGCVDTVGPQAGDIARTAVVRKAARSVPASGSEYPIEKWISPAAIRGR